MPYANSQSPVTSSWANCSQGLGPIIQAALLAALEDDTRSLGKIAEQFDVAFGPEGEKHVTDWPLVPQELIRECLILGIDMKRQITPYTGP